MKGLQPASVHRVPSAVDSRMKFLPGKASGIELESPVMANFTGKPSAARTPFHRLPSACITDDHRNSTRHRLLMPVLRRTRKAEFRSTDLRTRDQEHSQANTATRKMIVLGSPAHPYCSHGDTGGIRNLGVRSSGNGPTVTSATARVSFAVRSVAENHVCCMPGPVTSPRSTTAALSWQIANSLESLARPLTKKPLTHSTSVQESGTAKRPASSVSPRTFAPRTHMSTAFCTGCPSGSSTVTSTTAAPALDSAMNPKEKTATHLAIQSPLMQDSRAWIVRTGYRKLISEGGAKRCPRGESHAAGDEIPRKRRHVLEPPQCVVAIALDDAFLRAQVFAGCRSASCIVLRAAAKDRHRLPDDRHRSIGQGRNDVPPGSLRDVGSTGGPIQVEPDPSVGPNRAQHARLPVRRGGGRRIRVHGRVAHYNRRA